ncbi:hypothetical protein P153DRAFT_411442 [Dothidotthia symphoricarpi CBS 119687]|uniref:Uncharacterized protein n=1 Tax=Dothidotthia symphoricarpi CBS 119687 TaxID=1392245 RepID=A0A6A5ZZV7_9PLEO|nr:uncharacterized protein P153DRAFT_411442 [Dothidotthia symphoricarpi CBS 119687]KAF2124434.1 hypothetical protein P153DRAFT_411442 [Dothidotthia symphoricarpi CBS 119687]
MSLRWSRELASDVCLWTVMPGPITAQERAAKIGVNVLQRQRSRSPSTGAASLFDIVSRRCRVSNYRSRVTIPARADLCSIMTHRETKHEWSGVPSEDNLSSMHRDIDQTVLVAPYNPVARVEFLRAGLEISQAAIRR